MVFIRINSLRVLNANLTPILNRGSLSHTPIGGRSEKVFNLNKSESSNGSASATRTITTTTTTASAAAAAAAS